MIRTLLVITCLLLAPPAWSQQTAPTDDDVVAPILRRLERTQSEIASARLTLNTQAEQLRQAQSDLVTTRAELKAEREINEHNFKAAADWERVAGNEKAAKLEEVKARQKAEADESWWRTRALAMGAVLLGIALWKLAPLALRLIPTIGL